MSQRLQDFSDFSHDLFHFYNFKKTKIPSSFLFPNNSFLQEVELWICVGLYAQLNEKQHEKKKEKKKQKKKKKQHD